MEEVAFAKGQFLAVLILWLVVIQCLDNFFRRNNGNRWFGGDGNGLRGFGLFVALQRSADGLLDFKSAESKRARYTQASSNLHCHNCGCPRSHYVGALPVLGPREDKSSCDTAAAVFLMRVLECCTSVEGLVKTICSQTKWSRSSEGKGSCWRRAENETTFLAQGESSECSLAGERQGTGHKEK